MLTYKTTVNSIIYRKNFASLELAEAYFEGIFGAGISVKQADPYEQIPDLSPEEKAERHRAFGRVLFDTFLNDNAVIASARGSNFTIEETLALDAKFGSFGRLCQYGSIPQIQQLLPSIEVDAIFTQERKDKYIEMVNNHLAA